jgi:cytoskeletal protein CcmA (bactofilin family)
MEERSTLPYTLLIFKKNRLMFSSVKEQKSSTRVNGESNHNQPVINIISDGTVITGKIVTENDFRISGKIIGELDVKGKCIVTQSGHISGDLRAHDADISGKTDGNIVIGNKLYLRHSAHVTGDIHTKTLLIEEGAIFEGVCHMSGNPLKDKKSVQNNDVKLANRNGKDSKEYKPGFALDEAGS